MPKTDPFPRKPTNERGKSRKPQNRRHEKHTVNHDKNKCPTPKTHMPTCTINNPRLKVNQKRKNCMNAQYHECQYEELDFS